jgi:hypothetical protein
MKPDMASLTLFTVTDATASYGATSPASMETVSFRNVTL